MNWRALLDLWPRKVDSLSDAKRSAWKAKPGDGINPPRQITDAATLDVNPVASAVWDERLDYPVLIHPPQVDVYGNWKRH